MRAEHDNLYACIAHAKARQLDAQLIAPTGTIAGFAHREGPWTEAIELRTGAVAVARRLRDKLGEANALADLAILSMAGNNPGAAEVLDNSIAIYHDLGEARTTLCQRPDRLRQ